MATRHDIPARVAESDVEALRAEPPAWLAQSWANRTGKKPVWVELTCDICGFHEQSRPKKWWPEWTWLSCAEHPIDDLPEVPAGQVRGEFDGVGSRFVAVVDQAV